MKIGGFFGLTGINLCLSPVDIGSFKKMVDALDTPTNRENIAVLHHELCKINNFLDNLPVVYTTPRARKAAAQLKQKRYNSEEEKCELEGILADETPVLAKTLGGKTGILKTLSEPAYKIVNALYNRRDDLNFFLEHTNYSSDSSGVTVLGDKLYLLRMQEECTLVNRLQKIYKCKGKLSQQKLQQLEQDVKILKSYCVEDKPVSSISNIQRLISQNRDLICSMNIDYFNSLFDLDLSLGDYVKVGKELQGIGLVGFSAFTSDRFEDFCRSVSLTDMSDLTIVAGTDLYSLVQFLSEVLDNYHCVKGVI